jgi:hypothetical protein
METGSLKAIRAWKFLGIHTFTVAAGLLELLDITLIENKDEGLGVLGVLEVSARPSGWRDNGLREASGQGGRSGWNLLRPSC